jgi:hypothetical protein
MGQSAVESAETVGHSRIRECFRRKQSRAHPSRYEQRRVCAREGNGCGVWKTGKNDPPNMKRMESGENISALARELTIKRDVLYRVSVLRFARQHNLIR